MSRFNLTVKRTADADVSIITVSGHVDEGNAIMLDQSIGSELRLHHRKLVLDLGDAHYIDHAGWQSLLERVREIQEEGGDLKFARMKPALQELFEALGFPALADAYPTIELAIAAFDRES